MTIQITIGIQGKGSSTEEDIKIISALLKEEKDICIEPIMEDDPLLRLQWLKQGKLDLFYEGSQTPLYFNGNNPEEISPERGPFQLRIMGSAHSGSWGYLVRGDSNIKTIYDIGPDTKIGMPAPDNMIYALLAWLELNIGPIPKDPKHGKWNIEFVYNDFYSNLHAVADGKVDVAVATAENPYVKEMAEKPNGIRFLELPSTTDIYGFSRFKSILPHRIITPAPEYGVREIWGKNSVMGLANIWCRDDFDTLLAYQITEWFETSYEKYKHLGHKLRTYTLSSLKMAVDQAMVPVHIGTVEYLANRGLWLESNSIRQEHNSHILDLYCEVWEQSIRAANKLGIEVSSRNQLWIDFWKERKREGGLPEISYTTDEEIQILLNK